MLPQARLNDIVRKVNEEGSVRVKELSVLYQVTEDCIRKDLTNLEKQGLLKRIHGGALPVRVNLQNLDVETRKDQHVPEKIIIAKQALSLLNNGDMVFLDISTISLELAKLLKSSSLQIHVVTNMIDVMLQLIRAPHIKTIFIGGTFNRGYDGFVGCITNEQLSRYRFDLALMGTVGVDVYANSVLTYMPEDGSTKETVLKQAHRVFVMMESSKFFNDGTYQYATLNQIDGIVTETSPSPTIVKELEQYGVQLVCPQND